MSLLLALFSIFVFSKSTRLLPADGSIIHCAGQSNSAFVAYSKYLNDNTSPAVYMYYIGLDNSLSDITNKFNDLESELNKFSSSQWVGIQIGLDFNGLSTKIANGGYTQHILTLIDGMKSTKRPCWIRLGYEFNGGWNDYAPKSDYIKSYRIITEYLRNDSWANKYVANVWDYSADAKDDDYSSWYPGDQYVDWYGINIFSGGSSPTSSKVHDFVNNGCNKKFPIILGESTPRDSGVLEGETSWNKWFEPYFYDLITSDTYDCIKGFCYIDWNWTSTEEWPTWGDAQIQDNEYVGQHYQTALDKGPYFQASNKSKMLSRLGL